MQNELKSRLVSLITLVRNGIETAVGNFYGDKIRSNIKFDEKSMIQKPL